MSIEFGNYNSLKVFREVLGIKPDRSLLGGTGRGASEDRRKPSLQEVWLRKEEQTNDTNRCFFFFFFKMTHRFEHV